MTAIVTLAILLGLIAFGIGALAGKAKALTGEDDIRTGLKNTGAMPVLLMAAAMGATLFIAGVIAGFTALAATGFICTIPLGLTMAFHTGFFILSALAK